MTVQPDHPARTPASSQAERDEADNRAVREAWLFLAGTLPLATEQGIARGEVFYSALDLAEQVIGSRRLAGWRISFTTDGGPYEAALLLQDPRSKLEGEITSSHPTSLTLALISAIRKWADDVARETFH
jgi:hypothetical protein